MTAIERKVLSLLVLTGVIWGVSFPVIKNTLNFVSPLTLLFYRFALASLVMTPMAYIGWRMNGEHVTLRRISLLCTLGLSGTALSLVLLYYGMNLTLASRAVLFVSINPITARFLLSLFGFKKLTKKQVLAMSVILIGVFLALVEPLLTNTPVGTIQGNLLSIASGIAWAGYMVTSKYIFGKNTKANSPITQMALTNLAATAALIPILALISPSTVFHPIASLDSKAVPGILYLGVLSTILGFTSFESALKVVKPKVASFAIYAQPLIAIPLSMLWLSDPLTPLFLLGTGIITVGAYVVEK